MNGACNGNPILFRIKIHIIRGIFCGKTWFLPSLRAPFSHSLLAQYSRCRRGNNVVSVDVVVVVDGPCFAHLFLLIRQSTTSYLLYLECLRGHIYSKKRKQKKTILQIALRQCFPFWLNQFPRRWRFFSLVRLFLVGCHFHYLDIWWRQHDEFDVIVIRWIVVFARFVCIFAPQSMCVRPVCRMLNKMYCFEVVLHFCRMLNFK